ncbi:MAG TPA: hypothetical protein VH643_40840 [Gemmataceae bacterium]|jgi:hypothetical protein
MIVRWIGGAGSVAVLLFGALAQAQYTFPPEKHDDMEAQLTVQAANKTAEAGLGEVTLTLTVIGPETLEVEEPQLGDPTAAWKEERLTSARAVRNQRATWRQIIRLKQRKKGVETVPDLSVRFRSGPQAEWKEAKWIDILKQARDVFGPPRPPEDESSWLRRRGLTLAVGAAVLLVLAAWIVRRRRGRSEPPLPPDQWALREFDRIESTLTPPRGDAEAFHTQLSLVVRRYLAERYVPHALQQTTAEFLDAVRQVPQLPAEQQERLRDLFERCDLAKFARASTPPEECRRSAELARELVQTTTSARSTKSISN